MNVLDAIRNRRSIRIFKKDAIPDELIQKLLETTVLAPSAHNKQPWRFVVLENERKDEFVKLLEEVYSGLIALGEITGSLKRSISCIKRAYAFILVFNAGSSFRASTYKDKKVYEWILDLQSIGGAIQTMILAAHAEGVGTLWTCEILYADDQIRAWLNRKDELIGGVCLGYADENPNARSRLKWNDVTEWLR